MAGADIGQGLIRSLLKPYWAETDVGWRGFFRSGFFDGPFDVKARDELVVAIGQAVRRSAQAPGTRIVILEHIGQRHMYGSYERAVLATVSEPDADLARALAARGAVLVQRDKWDRIGQRVEELVRVGGCNAGFDHMYDATDALVLTYYDGRQWRIETWFCISSSGFLGEPFPTKADELPPQMRAYGRLLHCLSKTLAPEVPFQSKSDLIDLVDDN